MKWFLKDPVFADMIRVKTGNIYHYGIFVSENEVIQFGLAPAACPNVKPCDIEVCTSDIDTFLCGNFLEVGEPEKKEFKKLRPPEEIVKTARARIGEKNYSIIYNNCEHFAYECVLGKKYCSQTDSVRDMFRSFPIVDVYFAKIPHDQKLSDLCHKNINDDIISSSNENIKRCKYFAWKLLEYALNRTFGKNIKKLNFYKTSDEKWKCDACEFDMAYIDTAVAIIVSRKPVRITLSTDNETLYDTYDWQRKLEINNKRYFISVCSENIDKIRFYDNCEL